MFEDYIEALWSLCMLQLDRQRRKTCQIPYCVIPIYGPDIYCFFLRKLKYSVRIYTVVNQLIQSGVYCTYLFIYIRII